MSETKKRKQTRSVTMLALLVVFSLALLLSIEFVVMTGNNREQAYRTAAVLSDQVASVLEANQRKESALIESLKENYIAKAKAVAYIIDQKYETGQAVPVTGGQVMMR